MPSKWVRNKTRFGPRPQSLGIPSTVLPLVAFRFISLCAVLLPATVIFLPFSEDKTLRRDARPETAIMQSDCIAVALREASAPDNEDTVYIYTVLDSSAELKRRHYMEEIKRNERWMIAQEQKELYENYPLDVLQEPAKSGDIHALHELGKKII